ncbi:MAG TPA: helix-turn-helix domain-containing protein [Solirubrobacteraceae bacterium]
MEIGTEDRGLYVALLRRLDVAVLADSLVELFRIEIPAYSALPDAVLHGQIREITQLVIELFVRWIEDGDEPTDHGLEAIRESAVNRASEGLALHDLLRAYRIGARHSASALITMATTPEERAALVDVGWLMMDYIDRVSSAVTDAYVAVRQHDVSEEARHSRELLDCLCADVPIDESLRVFARSRGFALLDAYRPFALAAPGVPAHMHSQLAASLRLVGRLALSEGTLVVGLAAPEETGATLGPDRYVLALGRPVGRPGLAAELDQARSLLALALDAGRTAGRVEAREFLVDLVLRDPASGAGLLREHVVEVLEQSEPMRRLDAIGTLEAYVDSGLDRRRAAERLGVHPNTLDHRLARIAQAGGVDPRSPDGLALVVLALRARRQGHPARPL